MSVNDIDGDMGDLDLEGMIVEQDETESLNIQMATDRLLDHTMGYAAIKDLDTTTTQNMRQLGTQERLEPKEQSKYKAAALQELCLAGETDETIMMHEEQDGRFPIPLGAVENTLGKQASEIGGSSRGASTAAHESLKSQIDDMLGRVEEAMTQMAEGDDNDRVKRTVRTSAEEVRNLTQQLGSHETVEGMLMKDEAVVVFVSSETSGESGDKKRKRKVKLPSPGGSVASRIRRKGTGPVKGGANVASATTPQQKRPRLVVRKIRSSVLHPNTSLTLAPPTMGLPPP